MDSKLRFCMVNIEVSDQMVIDNFISACEGGSNYWCIEINPRGKSKDAYKAMLPGFEVVDEDGKKHEVTETKIRNGLKLMAEKYPIQFGEMMAEEGDATTADIFLQLCAFGELVYG